MESNTTKTTEEQFKLLLKEPEGAHLECKPSSISSQSLSDYCAAIANEGGGKLILGVTDKEREIIGTKSFAGTLHELPIKLLQALSIRVDAEELKIDTKRVVIFHIPSHPVGILIKSNGRYLMRAGSSLVEMTSDKIREIVMETIKDFSAQIVPGLALSDIDEESVNRFRALWAKKQGKLEYLSHDTEKILRSIEIFTDKEINYAGLILFGKKEKIAELLPGAEIIYEWRQEKKISHDFRSSWRDPFFKIYDDIWAIINARNSRTPFQEGFVQREISAFTEAPIREAVLNAVAHRDYKTETASIIIKASPDEFTIESPGGFLPGITPENIIEKSEWRNRRIAEILEKAGLIERSGQGMEVIFGTTIREGKGLPSFKGSDQYSVKLSIPAKVKDEQFIKFLEKVANEKQISLTFEEIYELENIRENKKVKSLKFKDKFLEMGIIEKIGRTSSTQYILSHKWYEYQGKAGIYTRIAGLSRDRNKQLIVEHLKKNKKGARNTDFRDALGFDQKTINNFLQELKDDGKVRFEGKKRTGKWLIK
ncbi:MAG: putative DNA binding domain-containing protein [Candidatus Saganbacteria bacterium]|nr:putative DNA binding domain-containing protein [Candidatus Saganbacteria bacterium]